MPLLVRDQALPPDLQSPLAFLQSLKIQDEKGQWLPFSLWPQQVPVLGSFSTERKVISLKARQLGLTWIALGYALYLMRTEPGITTLFFSVGLTEAKELLRRLKGMYDHADPRIRLPDTRAGNTVEWFLPNGSRALSFPSTAGISYTARLAVVDEADKHQDGAETPYEKLDRILDNVKPTVDAGGQLFLISTSNKRRPASRFKQIYRAAVAGETTWAHHFLPWDARPARTVAWYETEKAESLKNTGSLDHVHQEYPATPEEALSERQLDKRLPYDWLRAVYHERPRLPSALPLLRVYELPQPGRKYVIGADPAEGIPNRDDSAAAILDALTGRQVALLRGKIEPTVFGLEIGKAAAWYNRAAVMVERNNHGHTTIAALRENGLARILPGHDGKPGWMSSTVGKALLYDATADAVREQRCEVCDQDTFLQLASIEGGTLRAPEGRHDDLADAFALGVVAAFGWRQERKQIAAYF